MRSAVVVAVSVTEALISVDLDDDRRLAIPTAWSSRLANAAVAARATWRIGDAGDHVSWPDVDEDIGIWTFLGVSGKAVFEANESARSGKRASRPSVGCKRSLFRRPSRRP